MEKLHCLTRLGTLIGLRRSSGRSPRR